MATYAERLEAIRDNIARQLQEMTASPKPDYGRDGVNVSWGSHFQNLMNALEEVEKRIQRAGSPFWKINRMKA